MKTLKFAALSVSAVMLISEYACLPETFASARSGAAQVSLEEFTKRVRQIVSSDGQNTQTITFDKRTGILSGEDGGTLAARNGQLYLSAESETPGGSAYVPFEQGAEEYGYTYTEDEDVLTITDDFQTARLIVKSSSAIDPHGASASAEGYRDLHILQYDTPAQARAAFELYEADSAVEYVQPSRIVRLAEESGAVSPNTWGAEPIGTADFTREYLSKEVLPQVTVAVIDTGLNTAPALFSGRVLEGGVNISNSGNDTIEDDYGHGTHCTGTICELTPSNVKILPIKAFDKKGEAADEQIYLALMTALEQGADIVNMSFGGLGVSPLEVEAMAAADEAGVICCAAAGNNADDAIYYYPGSIASCITVGAVDSEMKLANFSNYGRMIDVCAPGVDVLSYTIGGANATRLMNGTSMATPHVTACCALLKSADPEISPARAENLLRLNAKDLGIYGFDETYGWGFVNMKDFRWDDGICCPPRFTEASGNFAARVTVELQTETEGAQIYYTTDGTTPSRENGTLYEGPFALTESAYLLAVAVKDGFADSTPTEASYSIGGLDALDTMTVENGVLTHYGGVRSKITVPESFAGQTITAIGDSAFANRHTAESVTLPETVKSIGRNAFSGCENLTEVTASGADTIGANAFSGCEALKTLTLAKQLRSVGEEAFLGCIELRRFSGDGLTELPDRVFSGCETLTSVDIPDVKAFGDRVFYGCEALAEISCGWEQVTSIGAECFKGCALWSGDLPLASLRGLGEAAWEGCAKLRSVQMAETVTQLPAKTFSGCSSLRLLTLPGVTVLGASALATGAGREIETDLDYGALTEIGENAFSGFVIGGDFEITVFDALETFVPGAFSGAKAGALSFPAIKELPARAFSGASVRLVVLENASVLGAESLRGCSAVVLSPSIQTIAPNAWDSGIWVVTADEIPALEAFSDYTLCMEPLVMGYSATELTCGAGEEAPLSVLAGAAGARYQWYEIAPDGSLTPCADGQNTRYYADTSLPGTALYRLVITDKNGKTEQVDFTVTTREGEEKQTLSPGETALFDGGGERVLRIRVPESGSYRLVSFGGAPIEGVLLDQAGKPVGEFAQNLSGASEMTARMEAEEDYTVRFRPLWEGEVSLLAEKSAETPHTPLSSCAVEAEPAEGIQFGETYTPNITVRGTAGETLTPDTDYRMVTHQHQQICRVSLFGIGAYEGYVELEIPLTLRVPEDTAIPVSIDSETDTAVFLFVPKSSGTYHYYATYAQGYAEEQEAFNRAGSFQNGSRFVSIRTSCTVSETPDGYGQILGSSTSSPQMGSYFGGTVELSAGQSYYFICGAKSAAEYNLVISTQLRDLRLVKISGSFGGTYDEDRPVSPDVTVTLGGEELTEGKDYLLINTRNDAPGKAELSVVGTGLYIGRADFSYEIMLGSLHAPMTETSLDTPVSVSCGDEQPLSAIRFELEAGAAAGKKQRVRILNERTSGGALQCSLYLYNERLGHFGFVTPIPGTTADYELRPGTYCAVFSRQYHALAGEAAITVVKPYDLSKAEVEAPAVPYTGGHSPAALTVTVDGTVLTPSKDYTLEYPNDNILFGETPVSLRPTNRSYNSLSANYEIAVRLPQDAPEISAGEHQAELTMDARLAIYKVTAEEETTYMFGTSDVEDIVLRVFSPKGEMLEEVYGEGTQSLSFTIPAHETRFLMVKFNGTEREGTINFLLESSFKLLSDCEVVSKPVTWTGERREPDVQFYDGDYKLREGVDYQLRYTANDTRIGTASANYIGMGDYFGVCNLDYDIVAAPLFDLEDFETVPVTLNASYKGTEDTACEFLIYEFTAGVGATFRIDLLRVQSKLAVQRYDSDGVFRESLVTSSTGDMSFDLAAGETVYLLFAPIDVVDKQQEFGFMLRDTSSRGYKYFYDTENGVTYRVFKDLNMAEVYTLNKKLTRITLLPEVEGVPVTFLPRGAFYGIPAGTVVYGYEGCPAAEYADQYHFAYVSATQTPNGTGDINCDGTISVSDGILLSRLLSETSALTPSAAQIETADLNGDGFLDSRDFSEVLRLLARGEPQN